MPTRTKTRTPADALADAREAQSSADALEAKAADARAEAARIDAEAVDILVNDPGQVDRIGREVDAQTRLASAYAAKAAAERARRDKLTGDALALEAERLDRDAQKAVKDAEAHQAKVDDLMAQLEDLDGVSYGVALVSDTIGAGTHYPPTRGTQMTEYVEAHHVQASMIRYYLEHGQVPEYSNGLDYLPEGHPLAGRMVVQHREMFIHPMLDAHRAGTILDHTPEA